MHKSLGFFAAILILTGASLAQTPPPTTQPIIPVSDTDAQLGKGKVIGLDYFYNHQIRNGKPFHYTWEDTDRASGYSKFGQVWEQYGATLAKLEEAPTADDLKKFSVYIIVNPNTPEKAADHKPNYIEEPAIDNIVDWVKAGGVLALFANDKNNCEFEHLNQLSQKLGITFNDDLRNTVPTPRDRAHGTFSQLPAIPLFDGVRGIYMKEICTLQVADPATAILTAPKEAGDGQDIIIATSQVGKGFVFAVGDPWIYNEYIDVTSPGLQLDNRKAAMNLAKWLLSTSSPPQTN